MKKYLLILIAICFYQNIDAQNWNYVNFPNSSVFQKSFGACIANGNLFHLESNFSVNQFQIVKYTNGVSQAPTISIPSGASFPSLTFNHLANQNNKIYLAGKLNTDGVIYEIDNSLTTQSILPSISSSNGYIDLKGITVNNNELFVVGNMNVQWPSTNSNVVFGSLPTISIVQPTSFLAKYSLVTNSWQWVKLIYSSAGTVQDIITDKNGFLYVTGNFANSITVYDGLTPYTFSNTIQHNYLARFNSLGNYDSSWGLKQLSTNGNTHKSFDIKVDDSQVFYIGYDRINGHSILGNGNLTWQKQITATAPGAAIITQLALNNCNEIYASGTTSTSVNRGLCGPTAFISSYDRTSNSTANWVSNSTGSESRITSLLVGSNSLLYTSGSYGGVAANNCSQPMIIDNNFTSVSTKGIFIGEIDDADYSIIPKNFLGGDIIKCIGTPVILNAGVTGYLYKWYKLPDLVTVISTQQTFNPTQSGTYRIEVTDLNKKCNRFDEVSVLFEDCDSCIIEPIIDTKILNCELNYKFNKGRGTATDIIGFHWDFGDNSISTLQNGKHIYTKSGVYKIKLTVFGRTKNGECCSVIVEKEIEIKCDPSICEIDKNPNWGYNNVNRRTKQFNNYTQFLNGTQLLGYYWDFGDGSFSNAKEPTHTFSGGGTYNVCMTAYGVSINGMCCEKKRCTPIEINGCLLDLFR